jgi:D-tyrosyl-tRNA(Tyr) deacylase
VEKTKARGLVTRTGVFQAHMEVELINDGPVTLLLEV